MGNQPRADFHMHTQALPNSVLSTNTARAAHGTFEFGLFNIKQRFQRRVILSLHSLATPSSHYAWMTCAFAIVKRAPHARYDGGQALGQLAGALIWMRARRANISA